MPNRNSQVWLAMILSCGFMILVGMSMFAQIPETSQRIVDGGLGALGASLANAISGIFRTDRTDEQRSLNTATALNTISQAIKATPPKDLDDV
jgi:hypothetical protein